MGRMRTGRTRNVNLNFLRSLSSYTPFDVDVDCRRATKLKTFWSKKWMVVWKEPTPEFVDIEATPD